MKESVSNIINRPGKTIRFFLFSLLFLVLISALVFVLHSYWKSMSMGKFQEKITSDVTFVKEDISKKIFDIEIKAHIAALDDMTFSESDLATIKKYNDTYKNSNHIYDSLIHGFDVERIWESDNFPFSTDSFRRFRRVLKDEAVHHHLKSELRREVILSEEFWKLNHKGVRLLVFPPGEQLSVAVLMVSGIKGPATLLPDVPTTPFKEAISKICEQKSLIIQSRDDVAYICMAPGEKLKFRSKKHEWTLTLESVVNPGSWRGNEDFVILDWTAIQL